MKTKKIHREGSAIGAYIIVLTMGFFLFYMMFTEYPEDIFNIHENALGFTGGMTLLIIVCYISLFLDVIVRMIEKYIISSEKIQATGPRGKILNEIYVSEIVQTGIVGEKLKVAGKQSEYFDMPRYIYLSKRVLTEDERKDILRAASDGSVLLFRYSDKLKRALNDICGIYVA